MKLAYCMKGNFNGGWGINAFPGLLPCKNEPEHLCGGL